MNCNQQSRNTLTSSSRHRQPNQRFKNPYRWSRFDSKQDKAKFGPANAGTSSFNDPTCKAQSFQKHRAVASSKGWTDSDRGEDLPLKESREGHHSSEDHRYHEPLANLRSEQLDLRHKILSTDIKAEFLSGQRYYKSLSDLKHGKQQTYSNHIIQHTLNHESLTDAERDWKPPDHKYQEPIKDVRRYHQDQRYQSLSSEWFHPDESYPLHKSRKESDHSDKKYPESWSNDQPNWVYSDKRYQEPLTESQRDWQLSDQKYLSTSHSYNRDRLHSEPWFHNSLTGDIKDRVYSDKRYQKPWAESKRDYQHSEQKYQEPSINYRIDHRHSEQRHTAPYRTPDIKNSERFQEPLDYRSDHRLSEPRQPDPYISTLPDWKKSDQRHTAPFINSPPNWQNSERRFQEPLYYRSDRRLSEPRHPDPYISTLPDWKKSEQRHTAPFINSPPHWQNSERRFQEPLYYRSDRRLSEPRHPDPYISTLPDWKKSDQRHTAPFINSLPDIKNSERFQEPLDYRSDHRLSEPRQPDPYISTLPDWKKSKQRHTAPFINSPPHRQNSDRRFQEPLYYRSDRRHSEQRHPDLDIDFPSDWQQCESFQEPMDYSIDQQCTEPLVNYPSDWQHSERRFQELLPHNRERYTNNFQTSDGLDLSQDHKLSFQPEESGDHRGVVNHSKRSYDEDIDGTRANYEPSTKRSRLDYQPIINNPFPTSSAGFVNSRRRYNHFFKKKLTWRQYIKGRHKVKQLLKEKNQRENVKPVVENAPRWTVLFQYLWDLKQPLEDHHIEYVKKQIELLHEKDKIKKPTRKWQPVFLEFTPRENGLAVVCENKISFDWLIKRKIPPVDDKIIVSCNALTPLKNVKLNFCIKNCIDSSEYVMFKFDKSNRGLNFKQFRVLDYEQQDGGSVLMTVLTDSRTVAKMKKIDFMVKYGQEEDMRMIKFFKCKKSDGEDSGEDLDDNETEEREGLAESKTPNPILSVCEDSSK